MPVDTIEKLAVQKVKPLLLLSSHGRRNINSLELGFARIIKVFQLILLIGGRQFAATAAPIHWLGFSLPSSHSMAFRSSTQVLRPQNPGVSNGVAPLEAEASGLKNRAWNLPTVAAGNKVCGWPPVPGESERVESESRVAKMG